MGTIVVKQKDAGLDELLEGWAARSACLRLTVLEAEPGPRGDTCLSEVAPLLECCEGCR